ncbi:hypothetical protein [uncultured Ruminococcus sp.]|uniref:hypothetical protein n=1 Tax=uncultured Ruminococcus sp. TaxID=165186 RepID=UPI00263486D2|nr:hypothetical protein [uncultured Ruminococcus sp.]
MPIEAEGDIGLTGNINITSGIKALNDVILSGNVENSQDSVICAETGNITINTDNVNLNGLVYAPYGCVNITAQNLNINSVIIIADTITITCPNLNANYNSQMAEFLGNESEPINTDDIEIVAYGEYDDETEVFSVYWNTTVPDGSFDIQISDDGESYISIGTVTNVDSFEYSFTEPFEKKYIKVIETTNNGTVFESVPFIVISTENGYDTKVLDSDEDGLPDIYELKIGTDPYDTDTDDDGLTDYQEYVFTQTDPLVYDSVTEGISDADADTDEDGLSNIDEFTRRTYPWTPDTDLDGPSDYDEIYVYGTDPLVADSDEDGIDDGSEIKLGLDPNDPATNGVPDGEYAVQQTISADNNILASVNTAESPYVLSIDIKTNGDAEEELTVDESGYSAAIENDAMIGASVNIDITDTCNPEEIVLKYDIKEAYIDNTLDKFSSLGEFQGIKRLNVFRFDEEEGMLLPVETEFDVENNKLYAAVNETGTYCLMDMEIWLDNLDVEMPAENNVPAPKAAPKAAPDNNSEWASEHVNNPIDIVFLLQTSGRDDDEHSFKTEKEELLSFCEAVFSEYADVRVYIIGFGRTKAEILSGETTYHTNFDAVKSTLETINYGYSQYACNSSKAFRVLIESIHLRQNADRFIYLVNSAAGICEGQYNQWSVIDRGIGIYSQIDPAVYWYDENERLQYIQRIKENGGFYTYVYYKVTRLEMLENLKANLSAARPIYDIYLPTRWKKIVLDGELTPNGATKSDKDPLTDWEEVDTSKITVNSDGSIELPVFRVADIIGHLTRFNTNGEYNFLLNDPTPRYYLPIHSDPTDEDTDDDGLNDYDDPEPLKKAYIKPFGTDEYKAEVVQKAELKYQGSYNHTWYNILDGVLPYYLNIKKENDYIAKAELDIMMTDVNNYGLYLKSVSDENWLSFCKFFNECVLEYGTVDEELHYFRLKLNRTPETLQDMIDLINSTPNINDKWIMCSPQKGRFHMFGDNGAYNIKFISSNNTDNIYEAVYDKNGNIITENNDYGKNMGTYNYASSSKHKKKHNKFDRDTYLEYGNTISDPKPIKNAENDNVINHRPADKNDITKVDINAQNHYIKVCNDIGIDYEELIKNDFSDKCY